MDLAEEFYRFIYTEEILNQFSEVKGAPSVAANPDNELYNSLNDAVIEDTVYFGDIDDPTSLLQDVYYDAAVSLLEGEISTSEDAVRMMEQLAAEKE